MRLPNDPDVLSQALAEPSRRAILEALRYGQRSVTDLVQITGRKQPNISNHLAKMRRQGLVRAERIGRQVYYSIGTPFAEILMRLHEITDDPLQNAPSSAAPAVETQIAHDESDQETAHNGNASHRESLALTEETLAEWRQAYFESVLTGNEDRVLALINAMLARRASMETIYIRIFQPVLHEIGEQFHRGELDVAQEHLASALTERMMAKVSQFYMPIARNMGHAVLGCVAGNLHSIGLRMLSDGLKCLGWETFFLGANVPTASFVDMVIKKQPNLVIISCMMEEQWPETCTLVEQLDALRRGSAPQEFILGLGGQYVLRNPDILHSLPIDMTASDMAQFLKTIQQHFAGVGQAVRLPDQNST
jgi:methanogenic corrinoid protein MtbC1/DNA-binding transcriptional ArsR family regulator